MAINVSAQINLLFMTQVNSGWFSMVHIYSIYFNPRLKFGPTCQFDTPTTNHVIFGTLGFA